MLGVPIEGPSIILGDNESVVKSAMIPIFRLKKRHNILAFHRVREAVASKIVKMVHLNGKENPADVLTKHRSSKEWYTLMRPLITWAYRDENVNTNENYDLAT